METSTTQKWLRENLQMLPCPWVLFAYVRRQSLYRFLTSVAHPSMPSPRPPTSRPSILRPFIPDVSSNHECPAMPPAFARLSGMSSSIGVRKSAMRFASSSLKWYFSLKTSCKAQCLSRWILRSSPLRLNISWLHLPLRQSDFGKGPRSSIIWAMWSSSFPYLVPD